MIIAAGDLLSYFEAIYWRKVDANKVTPGSGLQHVFKANAVFRKRGFWASKNPAGNTSRDRYTESTIQTEVTDLENQLVEFGCSLSYFRAIQERMKAGGKSFSLIKYAGALKRTLEAKQRTAGNPF